jgi:hypothetical protein
VEEPTQIFGPRPPDAPPPDDADLQVDGTPAGQQSILDAVKAEWSRQAVEHTYDVEVPGLQGRIVLRLGPIQGSTFERLRKRIVQSQSPGNDLLADVLIAACRGVWGRDLRQPDSPLVPLEDEDGPWRLDSRLAAGLELTGATTARQVVFRLFQGANSLEVALGRVVDQYMEWAARADADISEDLLGES